MGNQHLRIRAVLWLVALLFAAATILYSAIWMYYVRWEPKVQLGINYEYSAPMHGLEIKNVIEGSGAAQAGLRPGDRVVAVNRLELTAPTPFYDAVARGQPGDSIHLTVERPGEATPIELQALLGLRPEEREELPLAQRVAIQLIQSYPILFVVVGLPVLFLRLEDRNAWLLAMMFAGFIAGAPLLMMEPVIHPALRGFALAYKVAMGGLWAALFYYFFAVFPVPSPLDRRLPWLKRVLLGVAAAVSVPLGLSALLAGSSQPLLSFVERMGRTAIVALLSIYFVGVLVLGLLSLLWTSLRAPTAEARRKTRVMVWGTVAGLVPALLLQLAAVYANKNPYEFPFWLWAPCVLALFFLPLSFAYAVVKHRALEIPVLLKRSARYLLVQRGFTLLLVLFSATLTLLVARWFSAYLESQMEGRQPSGVALGVGLGIVLVWVGTHVRQRVTQRIDRAFFRTAYDARQILQDLAEKTRTAVNREELAKLLEQHVQQALFPKFLTVYLEGSEGSLRAVAGRAVPGLEVIPAGHPVLVEIARRGQPWELPPLEEGGVGKLLLLGPLAADCLVPILGRDHRLIGLLLLGPRLSEEPYSGEDKRLLGSVANQAGGALESIRLAEKIAARMEADRRTAWELEIAKQVQSRLLPQKAPALETLDYAGACIQARAVGGDYYDFLELGGGQLGLLLADIAGKGISGALLMAHLQASLRSQYAVALDDLPGLLERINRQLCDSTAASHFATLFFGCYEDRTRRLRYANCGHNPPLRLGLDGSVERLVTTAPVLGLLENWETTIEETQLTPGDTLLIFSDGISEAMGDRGEEFGDERLLETLRQHAQLAPSDLLAALIRAVQEFSGGEQEDDMTVVVARVR